MVSSSFGQTVIPHVRADKCTMIPLKRSVSVPKFPDSTKDISNGIPNYIQILLSKYLRLVFHVALTHSLTHSLTLSLSLCAPLDGPRVLEASRTTGRASGRAPAPLPDLGQVMRESATGAPATPAHGPWRVELTDCRLSLA